MKSFVAGLAIGGVLGWGAAVVLRAGTPDPTVSSPALPDRPPGAAPIVFSDAPRTVRHGASRARADTEPPPAPAAPTASEQRLAVLRAGDADAMRSVARRPDPLTDEELRVVADRLAAAQTSGDRDLYVRLLEVLARSASTGARQKLVDLLADTLIPLGTLKPNVYGDIDRWLENAGVVPGLAAAARKRYDAEPDAQLCTIGLGLMQLIGRHGDASDLAWLESKAGDPRTAAFALRAIPLSNDPAVEATVERLWGARRTDSEWLADYAARRPQAATALSTRLLKRADAGEDVPDARALFDVLGRAAVASKDAAPVSELLPTLRTPALRVSAVTAVQRLHDAKMDVTTFASLLEEPVRLLESGEWETARVDLRYLVEYHRLLWTPRVAAALDAAADRTGDKRAAEGFRRVAKLIRDAAKAP